MEALIHVLIVANINGISVKEVSVCSDKYEIIKNEMKALNHGFIQEDYLLIYGPISSVKVLKS